jgi:hypothetical protein
MPAANPVSIGSVTISVNHSHCRFGQILHYSFKQTMKQALYYAPSFEFSQSTYQKRVRFKVMWRVVHVVYLRFAANSYPTDDLHD